MIRGWTKAKSVSYRQSFTLIELLVAAGIAAVLAAAIVAAIGGGIRIWERARGINGPMTEAAIFLDGLEKEVRSSFVFHGVPFEGNSTGVRFPSLIRTPETGPAGFGRIGARRYFFEAGGHCLRRNVWLYPEPEPQEDKSDIVISSLDSLEFSYYYDGGQGGGALVSKDSWSDGTHLPLGLKVQMRLVSGDERVDIQRTILLPAAWKW